VFDFIDVSIADIQLQDLLELVTFVLLEQCGDFKDLVLKRIHEEFIFL
jgi:hypothetical protein